ncbi:hypothetical protein JHK87_016084 [Glycine soja]|nr:hypothetical protein JHK87_016084 [Glycine soja]
MFLSENIVTNNVHPSLQDQFPMQHNITGGNNTHDHTSKHSFLTIQRIRSLSASEHRVRHTRASSQVSASSPLPPYLGRASCSSHSSIVRSLCFFSFATSRRAENCTLYFRFIGPPCVICRDYRNVERVIWITVIFPDSLIKHPKEIAKSLTKCPHVMLLVIIAFHLSSELRPTILQNEPMSDKLLKLLLPSLKFDFRDLSGFIGLDSTSVSLILLILATSN